MTTRTWDGETNTLWSNGTNWSANSVPVGGDDVVINGGGGGNQPTLNVNSASLQSTTISAGTLTIAGGGVSLTSINVTLSGTGNMTINVGSNVSGNVAMGSFGSLVNNGTITGNLSVFEGLNSNAGVVTGNTTVSGGTLNLDAGTNLANSSTLTVAGSGTLNVSAADTVSVINQTGGTIVGEEALTANTFNQSGGSMGVNLNVSGAKTLNGGTIGGTLTGAGATTFQTGETTVTGSIIGDVTILGSGALRIDSATAVSGTITTAGAVVSYGDGVNEGSALVLSSAGAKLEVLASDTAIQSGIISSTGAFGFEKIGSGSLTVNGTNNYTGTTVISEGNLTAASDSALGTGAATVADGATLSLQGTITTANDITLNGDGGGGGALRNRSENNVVSGEITLASDARINSDAGQVDLNGNITGADTNLTVGGTGTTLIAGNIATGAGSLTVDATTAGGIVQLNGANTFTGGTTVSSGFLQLLGGSALADGGALTVNSPGVVQVIDGETVGALSGSGTIALQTADALVAGDGTDTTFSGQIIESGAVGTFTKDGTGTLTLTGTNTYTGATTINGGVLEVTSGSAIADTGSVIVGNGGTFTVNTNQEFIGNLSSSDIATSTAVVNNNGGLVITGSGDTTFDGNIAGAGQLTYQGTGSLTLTGANALTGNLVSSGVGGGNDGTDDGAINITGDGTVASGFITAIDGGTISTNGGAFISTANLIVDGANSSATLTGSETIGALLGNGPGIATTGTVTLTGVGTILTLNGSSPFGSIIGSDVTGTGTLNVTGGTTSVDAGGSVQVLTTIGALGTVTNAGTMAAVTSAGIFTSIATVTGNVTVTGGTTQFDVGSEIADTSVVTVSGGSATFNASDVIGALDADGGAVFINDDLIARTFSGTAGSVVLGSGISLTAGLSNVSSAFGGVLSGGGGLNKTGTGTLTLSGANTFAGMTSVTGGILNVTGSLASLAIEVFGGLRVDGTSLADTAVVSLLGNGNLTLTGNETIGSLFIDGLTSVTLGGNTLTLAAQATGLGGVAFVGNIGGADLLDIKLQAALANFSLSGVNFTNWTEGTDIVTITGNTLTNILTGNAGNNVINGEGGTDTLNGGDGDDTLRGGAGGDVLNGGIGSDFASYYYDAAVTVALDGSLTATGVAIGDTFSSIENISGSNTGNDIISGNASANRLNGNGGKDTLYGRDGADTLSGGDGDDTLRGGAGGDVLNGGIGSDFASYYYDAAVTVALDGSLTATGVAIGDTFSSIENISGSNTGNDIISGNASANRLNGNGGKDTLYGRDGADTLSGGDGDDTLRGGAGGDVLNGGIGSDFASYYYDAAVTVALDGSLVAEGTAVGDTFTSIEHVSGSNTGNDTIAGDSGANQINGNGGDDTLQGREGNDILRGGLGNDMLSGNADADQFVFDTALNATTNVDTISTVSSLDRIVLDNDIFTALGTSFTSDEFRSINTGTSFASVDASDNIIYVKSTGQLFYDRDGSGTTHSRILFADLTDNTVINHGHFLLIE